MFVSDFTEFSTYCYGLYETHNSGYQFLSCNYPILTYYDGAALGIYLNYVGNAVDTMAANDALYNR